MIGVLPGLMFCINWEKLSENRLICLEILKISESGAKLSIAAVKADADDIKEGKIYAKDVQR